jgi:hypothetical protein
MRALATFATIGDTDGHTGVRHPLRGGIVDTVRGLLKNSLAV